MKSLVGVCALVAAGACGASADDSPLTAAANSAAETTSDGAKALTGEEIVALPRRATQPLALPEKERIYVGSGVYDNVGKMLGGGFCFTYWSPSRLTPDETIDLCVKEKVGNTLQFWQHGEDLARLARRAKDAGLYATCIYSKAEPEVVRAMTRDLGPRWLGHDVGEVFRFATKAHGATLRTVADEYMNRVHRHVEKLHADGWGDVMTTSANSWIDYEVAAGVEIPCTEDFPFGDLVFASAVSRGLYRQYDLPTWGSHIAHEWYSWLPHRNPCKMKSLETAFYLKYMTGAKIILNESGNWALQSSLCEDSPMSMMPITARRISTKLDAEGREKYERPVLAEAKKKFAYIDWRSPVATKYRRAISDFYKFCQEHPAPKGQPEATWAIAKGNLDLGHNRYIPGYAIGGAYDLARKNLAWMPGQPEMSWDVLTKAVMPKPPMFTPNKNINFSGTPYGLCDVVSFAYDNVTAEFLLKNYKVLVFAGWNTCSPKQYKILCDYVKGGGTLVIGLCHLSTDDKREYNDVSVAKLVNGGDLTELCGVKVVGETPMRYWATGPSTKPNDLGFVARRRFGYMVLPLGRLEYVAPKESFEPLAVDDEEDEPFILRCRNGKGQVLLMNWWGYPAAANMDVGCGAEVADVGMVGYLYRYAAKLGRGNVYVTGGDFENPDDECSWVVCSYFPDEGKIYLLNLDYERPHKFVLHHFGEKDFITLAPAEFRILDSVRLDPEEKLNEK